MRELLIVSHGTLAEGIIESGKVILGDAINAKSCCLKMNMGIEDFKREVNEIIRSFKLADEIVILADLKGGSPYTATLAALDENGLLSKSVIITGVNLPLLINVSLKEDTITEEDIESLISESRKAIDRFEIIDDEEDSL
ncbi:hypothetical protein [Clostridium sp. Marseille-Q2269]|uniref:PTS sugar transporter subunit IIA n=1 Tax=Clostridium sp. Marseille-Q2269 TaxID=2942205 RepID=UPI002073D48D|nr:hypothetical protein [Clostridium sp. Marseille-Q2269]